MSNEYGIFQSIVEGDQAKDYKDNKEYEKNKAADEEARRKAFRYGSYKHTPGSKMDSYANPAARDMGEKYHKGKDDDIDRAVKSGQFLNRQIAKARQAGDKERVKKLQDNDNEILDAKNRHIRRHGNNESTIHFI